MQISRSVSESLRSASAEAEKAVPANSVDEWYDSKDAYKGSQRVLAAIFALVGLDGVSEPLLSRRKK